MTSRWTYRELFELFLQNHRPLMFRAFVSSQSPFECERCHDWFEPDECAVEVEDSVLCERCAKKKGRR